MGMKLPKESYRVVYQDASSTKTVSKFGMEYKKIEDAEVAYQSLLRNMRQDNQKSNGKVFAGGKHTYSIIRVALITKKEDESKWRILKEERCC